MLAIIIPAHNEEAILGDSLRAALQATLDPALEGERVEIIVVADSCNDETERIIEAFPVKGISLHARNVGTARAVGAACALDLGARWLAFTDADTIVPANWLSRQLDCVSDVVCGVVGVHDWTMTDLAVQLDFESTYQPFDGHRHIHGANLGVSADAYRCVGGFAHLPSDEDVNLVSRLEASGASICWTAQTKVWTSSRRSFRAPDGFGAALARVRQMVSNSISVCLTVDGRPMVQAAGQES